MAEPEAYFLRKLPMSSQERNPKEHFSLKDDFIGLHFPCYYVYYPVELTVQLT